MRRDSCNGSRLMRVLFEVFLNATVGVLFDNDRAIPLAQTTYHTGSAPRGIVSGDGSPNSAVKATSSKTEALFSSLASGTRTASPVPFTGTSPKTMAFEDVHRDKRQNSIVTCNASNQCSTLLTYARRHRATAVPQTPCLSLAEGAKVRRDAGSGVQFEGLNAAKDPQGPHAVGASTRTAEDAYGEK